MFRKGTVFVFVAFLVQLAILQDQSIDWEEGIRRMDDVIRQDPNNWDAWEQRGYFYARLDQHLKAVENLREAVRLNPEHPRAYLLLGTSLVMLKQYSGSRHAIDGQKITIEFPSKKKMP